MYTVVGSPRTRTLRVLWMLEEIGQSYTLDPAPPRSERVRALDPSGKVPLLLLDDGTVLTESVAILTYLADRHHALTAPAGTPERARQDGFTQFCVDQIEGPLWAAAKHRFVLPKELRVEAVEPACRHDFAQAMKILEQRLGTSTFVMGDRFSVPDILIGHSARWATAANFDPPDGGDGPLGAYIARILTRPALARALERGDAAVAAES